MTNPVRCAIWAFLGAVAGTKAVLDGVQAAKERKAKKNEAKKESEKEQKSDDSKN